MLPLLNEELQVTLTIGYSVASVASLWVIIFSRPIFEWIGVDITLPLPAHKKFPAILLLVSLLLHPVTFLMGAIGLWWYTAFAIVPAVHCAVTLLTVLFIEINRELQPWEKKIST